jgi:hypothetical protein
MTIKKISVFTLPIFWGSLTNHAGISLYHGANLSGWIVVLLGSALLPLAVLSALDRGKS